MMPFPKIHDLHVARVVTATVLLVWTVLVGLDAVLAAADEVKNMGQGDYGFVSGLTYVAYSLPRRAYTMFPTAAVIGSLMGLGQLAATSELTALRALGVSRRRLSVSVAVPLVLVSGYRLYAERQPHWVVVTGFDDGRIVHYATPFPVPPVRVRMAWAPIPWPASATDLSRFSS